MSWPETDVGVCMLGKEESIWQKAQRHKGLEIAGKQPCLSETKVAGETGWEGGAKSD